MANKKEIALAAEHGYEQVKIFFPKPGETGTDEDSIVHTKEKPSAIWLNKKTGEWFEELQDLWDHVGEWPE